MFKKGGTIIFLLAMVTLSFGQNASVLSTGKWYKFSVSEDGIHKLDYNLLKKAGINPDQIDPRKIRLYAAGNGMLPQANSASRNGQLLELAISVKGESDGNFDKDDLVIFYGQGSDEISFIPDRNIFNYKNNLYSDKNFYFLTISDADGKRAGTSENNSGEFPIINHYDDFTYYETDKYNILSSGREWFGEQLDNNPEIRIRFDLPGIVENSDIKIVSHVMAQSQDKTSFKLSLNNIEVKEQFVASIPNTQYGSKGAKAIDTVSISANAVNASSQSAQEIKYQYIKSASKRSIGYLDFITISTRRKLNWLGNSFTFISSQSLQNDNSTFQISSFPANGRILEISNPFEMKEQSFSNTNATASFSTSTSELRKFIVFTEEKILSPAFENSVDNQNITTTSSVDLLIVAHPKFLSEAKRLAAHRRSHNNISVQVVTVDEVYNEYSGGKPDLTAIRDFARTLYSSAGLKNLLLFGRCSYDYKDRVIDNTNFVPTYESRNSLSPLETYSSDDYFGFLEIAEGEWLEDPVQNHTMEIGVGRLSVKKADDAKNMVDKLIAYDLNKNAYGKWRKDIVFVADDGDSNLHQDSANELADNVELSHPEFNTTKIFLDSYKQLERPSGQYSPDANDAFNKAVEKGALIINYTGHGSEQVLMQEKILDPSSLEEWRNKNQFPLFVTATCEFGRHDDPLILSSGELILNKKNAGAIGLVTTSRPVWASTNFILNKAFYNSVFQKTAGKHNDLGTVFRNTKNQSLSGVSNRNFSLLGDPSMQLAIPEKNITIDEIKTSNDSDTLKALSKIRIKGKIRNGDVTASDFNGTLQATLFDKQSEHQTLGDENAVFTFKAWDHIILQGKASVADGEFEINSIVPISIAREIGNGKLSLYAYDETSTDQAMGAFTNFKVGLTEVNSGTDNQGPDIVLYMGDTTYRAGGPVASNTRLVAVLNDLNGINISGYEKGNLEIILDDSITFIGNIYYEASGINLSKGILDYPLNGLAKGQHTIKLKAWDTYGNGAEKTILFSAGGENQLIIDSFTNYPNPFPETTIFQFTHNRPGDDLEASVVVYNSMGQVINSIQYTVSESLYNVTLAEWSSTVNGTKLSNGIYFVKLLVRSLSDGAKNEKLTKLIILN